MLSVIINHWKQNIKSIIRELIIKEWNLEEILSLLKNQTAFTIILKENFEESCHGLIAIQNQFKILIQNIKTNWQIKRISNKNWIKTNDKFRMNKKFKNNSPLVNLLQINLIFLLWSIKSPLLSMMLLWNSSFNKSAYLSCSFDSSFISFSWLDNFKTSSFKVLIFINSLYQLIFSFLKSILHFFILSSSGFLKSKWLLPFPATYKLNFLNYLKALKNFVIL